jgi:hypothetical protein
MIGSSGLNIACERLLLGMRGKGRRDPKTKVATHLHPFLQDQAEHDEVGRRLEVVPGVIPAPEASKWRRGRAGGYPRTRAPPPPQDNKVLCRRSTWTVT